MLTLLTALTGGAAFASIENISVGDGLYWAITTMTTVGYGDITPKTPRGKAIAIAVMLIGIGFATLLIGAIAERFIKRPVHDDDDAEKDVLALAKDISARLEHLEQSTTEASRLTRFRASESGPTAFVLPRPRVSRSGRRRSDRGLPAQACFPTRRA